MKNKGITLIALVITIIIMLILVAVTVNYSIKSGLLGKAKQGKEKYKYKEEEDEIGAIRLEYLADEKVGKTDGDLVAYLRRELEGKNVTIESTSEDLEEFLENLAEEKYNYKHKDQE